MAVRVVAASSAYRLTTAPSVSLLPTTSAGKSDSREAAALILAVPMASPPKAVARSAIVSTWTSNPAAS